MKSVSRSTSEKRLAKRYGMKTAPLLCVMGLAAAFAGPADAIFKCITPKGVVYQDRPCREGNETDLQIVVPTGEVGPRQSAVPEEATPASGTPAESRVAAVKAGRRSADNPASVAKPSDIKGRDASAIASDSTRKRDFETSADASASPTIPEQAPKTEPSARYYTTDGFGSGTDTPGRLTCESASGEKRIFYLSNGKLTSI